MSNDTIDAGARMAQEDVGGPMPVYTGAQMKNALVAYQQLQAVLDEAMEDQIMDLEGKKFRKKGYWRAVAVAFNITVETIEERREVSGQFADGRDNFGYVISRRATAPNGRSVTADGTCFAVEKARRFKCPHPESAGSRRTLHFPHSACPDFDPEFQWRTLPGDATEHNVRGHASTRAFNRAVSDLVGFGEVSAEEVDASEHAQSVGHGSTPAAAKADEKPTVSADSITTVKAVTEKTGGTSEKPWTRFDVTFTDGRKGATFDKKIGDLAKEKLVSKEPVLVREGQELVKGERGTDLKGLAEPPKPVTPPPPELPVGPERILTIRKARGADGKEWFIVQGSEREYLTDLPDLAAVLERVKTDKRQVVFAYENVPTPRGGFARKLTGATDAPVEAPTQESVSEAESLPA